MKIALLEDDLAFAEILIEWLQEANFEVDHFKTGIDFLRRFPHEQYDLCIFDWALPDMEGPDVMVSIKLRANKLPPIIFFTGRSEEQDIVRVIEAGADDYVVKPASRPLLMARINALLRRTSNQLLDETSYEFDALKFDVKLRVVTLAGEEVKLTDKEFDLALYFLKNEGALLSRVHLMNVVWGTSSDVETRKVDVHISHLRSKLKLMPEYGWKLTSIYQQGYRLERNC
ncbi:MULTISPECIES: response regulator transcription factor [Methylotenera]|jgi:two-component system, OmpR family, response regulator RegX3|uniref:DNA-binding response regulator n=1 Tax=Methylotenera mobilis TaxID=359408 RepID=A0A351R967_9PROT|nr:MULTISPECIES: response regulator transcription factor [Methylotenera]MDP3776749.1 response regulator transcription factor [Methylotenera sp.]HBA08588.1 DNA-binding response regulator [Methylotenera mobilis]